MYIFKGIVLNPSSKLIIVNQRIYFKNMNLKIYMYSEMYSVEIKWKFTPQNIY